MWKRLDLGRQRAVLDAMVTVLPQQPGRMPDGSRFDPNGAHHARSDASRLVGDPAVIVVKLVG